MKFRAVSSKHFEHGQVSVLNVALHDPTQRCHTLASSVDIQCVGEDLLLLRLQVGTWCFCSLPLVLDTGDLAHVIDN